MERCAVNAHLPLDPLQAVFYIHFYLFYIQMKCQSNRASMCADDSVIMNLLQRVENHQGLNLQTGVTSFSPN